MFLVHLDSIDAILLDLRGDLIGQRHHILHVELAVKQAAAKCVYHGDALVCLFLGGEAAKEALLLVAACSL